MKTDRFSDSIRRKLESIRPDFKEKDWARMQAALLQQAAPPPSGLPTVFRPVAGGLWSARPWLMAAAAVSFVVLVSLAAWQRTQIATLRQTVSQLSRQQTKNQSRPASSETAAPDAALRPLDEQTARRSDTQPGPLNRPADQSKATASQRDTVYITRYVAVPARPANSAPDRTTQQVADAPGTPSVQRITPTQSLANAQPRQRTSNQSTTTERSNDEAVTGLPAADGAVANGTTKATVDRTRPVHAPTYRMEEAAKQSEKLSGNKGPNRKKRPSDAVPVNDQTVSGIPAPSAPAASVDSDLSTGTVQPAETYALTTSRPVTMDAVDWNAVLTRQAKRMRPVRTTSVGGQEAVASQPISQPVNPLPFGFRIGVGGELSRTVRSGSLLTELVIGKHLTVGVGWGLSSFAGGTFLTDEKFDQRKEHKPGKFRYDYTRGLDPRSDILNIGIHTERIQIPISLGYRIAVSPTLSLLPSVGTTLGLQSKEFVTFTYRQPFESYASASQSYDRPTDLFNNLTFGAGVEWKQNHWVVQAGPLLTVPTVTDANWQETASLGLRARLFYQF